MRAATPHPEPRQNDWVIEGLKALEHTLPASNGLPSHGHGRGFYVMCSPILFRNSIKQDSFSGASIFVWDFEDSLMKWYEGELSSGVINTWIIVVGSPVTTRITWTWCWWSIKGCNYFGDFPMPNVNPFGKGHVIYVTLYLELTSRLAPQVARQSMVYFNEFSGRLMIFCRCWTAGLMFFQCWTCSKIFQHFLGLELDDPDQTLNGGLSHEQNTHELIG